MLGPPPIHRRGRVRLAPVAPREDAVLVGEPLDRFAPIQLHGDDLVTETLAVLLKVNVGQGGVVTVTGTLGRDSLPALSIAETE